MAHEPRSRRRSLRPEAAGSLPSLAPMAGLAALAFGVCGLLLLLVAAPPVASQPPADPDRASGAIEPRLDILFLRQATDHPSTLAQLTHAERDQLGDPFFRLVLDGHADARDLDAIETLLQPDASRRETFVVSETILDGHRGTGRRAVLAYTGEVADPRGGDPIPLDGNVMLSVPFTGEGVPDGLPIEAWGWDAFRGRYNYYKLDGAGLGNGLQLWKFRGSSVGADLLSAEDREATCMACHTNGAPIMKELAFPWNNWHSNRFPVPQLGPSSDWPVMANDPRFARDRIRGAEILETRHIAPAIDQFNGRRLTASLERAETEVVHRDEDGNVIATFLPGDVLLDREGRARVMEGPRLLKHLFETTEINMGSANEESNLFPGTSLDRPDVPVQIPNTFFLDAHLIAGNGPVDLDGLGVLEARGFNRVRSAGPGGETVEPFRIAPDEYVQLLADVGQRLGPASPVASGPGDTGFAWFVPIASHMDNSMAEVLIDRGVVTREFVAAAAAVDLANPVFSEDRAALLRFVPETFRFVHPTPQGVRPASHPDALTLEVIDALEAASPAPGSPEALFLERLRADDPVELLRQDVIAYRDRLAARLADPATRPAELRRLYDLAHERRQAFMISRLFGPLSESNFLFPRR